MSSSNELSTIKGSVRLSEIIGRTHKLIKAGQSQFICLCPFHSDKTPSLRVYDDTGQYHCFAGSCEAHGDVFDWLEHQRGMDMREAKEYLGFGESVPTEAVEVPTKKEVVPIVPVPTKLTVNSFTAGYSTIYRYTNMDGDLLYQVARYEAKGEKKKLFLPTTHTESGWVPKAPTEGRVLYNLPSIKNDGMGFIFEGEKCVDVAKDILTDRAIITWMGGSGAADKTDMMPLQDDRKWTYWPDNDEGGIKTAHYLATVIENLYIVPIPDGKPKGWDIADAISEDGWTHDQVIEHINTRIPYSEWALQQKDSCKSEPISEPITETNNQYKLPSKLHGLCGEIEDWINSTAYKRQPLLAINAALVFVGALKGQRVCTARNLLTNMYALSLGESGCGKDHPRQCLEVLANEVGLQDKMMLGVPASGTALVKSVKRGGRCLIQIDELGRVIGIINGKNAGGFQREIVDNMMMLYSSASTLFREKEYAAGREDQEKNAIIKPCLCIHAMTVPERFYNNLTTDDVIDGFLSRWMIVASDNPDPDESEVDTDIENIPASIIDQVNAIQEMSTNVKIAELPTTSAQVEKIQNAINPKVIPLTPEAKTILTDYKNIARKLKNDLRTSGSPLNALWVRMGENAHKIALIIQDGDYITATDMRWACDWVMYWTQYSIDQVKEKLSENDYDKRMKHLLGVIRKHTNGITKSELINHTKYGKRVREELLDELEESGSIRSELEEGTTKKTKIYFAL